MFFCIIILFMSLSSILMLTLCLNDDSNLNPKQKKESFYLINTKNGHFSFLKVES